MLSAAIQLNAGPDAEANLARALAAVREAAGAGAKLVLLPEKWHAFGGAAVLDAVAEPFGGPLMQQLRDLAGELQIDLVAGSISERGPAADERLLNTSVHFRPDGSLGAAYSKVHLFDADIAGRRYRESDAEQPGHEPVVSQLADPAFIAGLTVCFDLRFPELFVRLAQAGANVITLPAAFTERTTRDHWEVLVRARAIELGAYVLAANQYGEHADGSRTGGTSLIVSPWGEVLARAGADEPAILYADLDPGAVAQAREALPVLALRRPEVYGRTVAGARDRAAASD